MFAVFGLGFFELLIIGAVLAFMAAAVVAVVVVLATGKKG